MTSATLLHARLKFLLLISIFAIPVASAKPTDCAKAQVVSGTSCSELKVAFDLSACGDSSAANVPTVTCSDNDTKARVSLKTERFIYRAKFKSKKAGWGKNEWTLMGRVTQTPNAAPPKETARESNASPTTAASVTAPQAAPAPTAPAPTQPAPSPFNFSGIFDGYYAYNFNHPKAVTPPPAGPTNPAPGNNTLRAYDAYHNQFSVSLAELSGRYSGKEASFTADLDFGTMADFNAQNLAAPGAFDEVTKHIGQAFVTYVPAWAPRLTIDFGKMATHMGLETYKAKDDWQYSRSILFWYTMPGWHMGLHAGYVVVPGQLSAGLYVYNGWNTLHDYNDSKTLGAQLKWTPVEALTVVYNYIGGPEHPGDNGSMKRVHEANMTYALSSSLSFAFEGVLGSDQNVTLTDGTSTRDSASWRATSLHARWQVTDLFYLSPRFEVIRDSQGALISTSHPSQPETLQTYTLTEGFALTKGLETRLEERIDHATRADFFTTKDGVSPNQATWTAALLFNF